MAEPDGLPWFSRDLTDLVHPLIPGRVYVVLAPTGTGKTLVGLNLVATLLQDTDARLLIAATEETPRYLDLLACRALGVSYADYFYGRLNGKAKDVAELNAMYAKDPRLTILPDREPTLLELHAALTATSPTDRPHLLLIDHLHCMDQERRTLPAFLELAMATLPALATLLNVVIVVLAQVHRPQARDPLYAYRIPTATSGMGSAKIEHNADVILGLSRKLKDDLNPQVLARLSKGLLNRGESVRDHEERNTARITVLKHRMDDDAARRSILLTVSGGKLQDRIALTGTDDYYPIPTREPGED